MHLKCVPYILNQPPTVEWLNSMGVTQPQMVKVAMKIATNIYIRCRLAEAQNWRCCWCGVKCMPESKHKNSATIEHVQPRSLGGEDTWDNYAMACSLCNRRRGTLCIEEFTAKLLYGYPQRGLPPKKHYHSRASKRAAKRRCENRTDYDSSAESKLAKHIRGGLKLAARGWVNSQGEVMCVETWIYTLHLPPAHVVRLRAGVFETA